MQCPKCGFEQDEGNPECIACGIIFSRFEERRGTLEAPLPGETLYSGPAAAGAAGDDLYDGPPIDGAGDLYQGDPAAPALAEGSYLYRPSILTLYAWFYGLGGILSAIGIAAVGLMGGGPKMILMGLIFGFAMVLFAMGIAGMSRIAWFLLILTALLGFAALPLGPIYNAFFIAFLLRPGTQVLFSQKSPDQLTHKERDDVKAVQMSNWSKGLIIGFWVTVLTPLIVFFGAIGANFDVLMDVRRQATTMSRIGDIRDEIVAYSQSEGASLSRVHDISELEQALQRRDYSFEMPLDGWKREFKFTRTRSGFLIVSAGRDGEFERTIYREGVTDSFDCDIVYSSDGWMRYADPRSSSEDGE